MAAAQEPQQQNFLFLLPYLTNIAISYVRVHHVNFSNAFLNYTLHCNDTNIMDTKTVALCHTRNADVGTMCVDDNKLDYMCHKHELHQILDYFLKGISDLKKWKKNKF